jgi:ubiquinone/menaquinone biosynthesis C-methylase UbiE
LEHLPNPTQAIKEFARLIKKDGFLVLTAPFCSLTHMAPYHYYTGFNKYFYEKHLTENGFEIIELIQNGNYFDFLSQELRRLNSVAVKYSNDKLRFWELPLLLLLFKSLKRFSRNDNSSQEILNFGIQVFAKKVN